MGDSPITVATFRAIGVFVATFIVSVLTAFQTFSITSPGTPEVDRWKTALISGAIISLTPFVWRTGEGVRDQKRADEGKPIPGDVAMASEKLVVTRPDGTVVRGQAKE